MGGSPQERHQVSQQKESDTPKGAKETRKAMEMEIDPTKSLLEQTYKLTDQLTIDLKERISIEEEIH